MICNAEPYEGNEPYLFFSYCHEDAEQVYPIIEHLAKDGYRIWYDAGMHSGADRADIIKPHLNEAALCIAIITRSYAHTHDCREELTLSVSNKAQHLIIIKLEDFVLSLGMTLQLATAHVIKRSNFKEESEFYQKLYKNAWLVQCLGEPQILPKPETPAEIAVPAHKPEPIQDPEKKPESEPEMKKKTKVGKIRKKTVVKEKKEQEKITQPPVAQETDEEENEVETELYDENDSECKTELYQDDEEDAPPTEMEDDSFSPVIIRLNTKEMFLGIYPQTRLGRSEHECDLYFTDAAKLTAHHADIIVRDDFCVLKDCNSANGTYLNGEKLKKNETKHFQDYAEISLSKSESFLVAVNAYAEWLLDSNCLMFLSSRDTGEKLFLLQEKTFIGRKYQKLEAMKEITISREQAVIRIQDNQASICNLSDSNKTRINTRILEDDSYVPLKDGDRIRMGKAHFVFHCCQLKEGQCL